jgi:hypothetical protein
MLEFDVVNVEEDNKRKNYPAYHVPEVVGGIEGDESAGKFEGPNRVISWDHGIHLSMQELQGSASPHGSIDGAYCLLWILKFHVIVSQIIGPVWECSFEIL